LTRGEWLNYHREFAVEVRPLASVPAKPRAVGHFRDTSS
jgi:hypothetical protein